MFAQSGGSKDFSNKTNITTEKTTTLKTSGETQQGDQHARGQGKMGLFFSTIEH